MSLDIVEFCSDIEGFIGLSLGHDLSCSDGSCIAEEKVGGLIVSLGFELEGGMLVEVVSELG